MFAVIINRSRSWQARPLSSAERQLDQLALIGILFCKLTSRLKLCKAPRFCPNKRKQSPKFQVKRVSGKGFSGTPIFK